jgi:hypothetical protein
MIAEDIIKLIANAGIPLAVELINVWKSSGTKEPTPQDYLDLIKKHHSLTLTYDEQIAKGP